MGISTSVLTQEDIQKLKKETDLKVKDIKKIHKKFGALDKDDKGYVNINDLVKIPEIEQNPLRYHIAQYMSNNSETRTYFIPIKYRTKFFLMMNRFQFKKKSKIN